MSTGFVAKGFAYETVPDTICHSFSSRLYSIGHGARCRSRCSGRSCTARSTGTSECSTSDRGKLCRGSCSNNLLVPCHCGERSMRSSETRKSIYSKPFSRHLDGPFRRLCVPRCPMLGNFNTLQSLHEFACGSRTAASAELRRSWLGRSPE